MKINKILIVLTIVFCSCSKNNDIDNVSNWVDISSSSMGNINLTDVEFLNDEFGIISGEFGGLMKTVDGGVTWNNLDVGTNNSLLKTFILNENKFFTSRNGIYKTADSGDSFFELGNFSNNEGSISSIYFFDSDNGIINKGSFIYRTDDGGQTWTLVYEQAEFANKMQFVSDNIGFFFGGKTDDYGSIGELYKTVDGGNNWEKINISASEITSMYFLDENVGYASNFENQVLKTQDGGINWEIIANQNQPLYDLIFLDDNIGYGISSNAIYLTMNGGYTWVKDYENTLMTFTSITSTPSNEIFVVGNDGIIIINK